MSIEKLAQKALARWDLPANPRVKLLNVSENVTYLVEAAGGYKAVLRVHRPDYHARRAIECELAWLDALRMSEDVATPNYFAGKNGQSIQELQISELAEPRFVVLFAFIEGKAPAETGDLVPHYNELGALAALCHKHALTWQKPEPFQRLIWDVETVFGPDATWGDWRDAPFIDPDDRATLERVEAAVRRRLDGYGKAPDRFNLIHADMRLANLIVSPKGTRLIDFDDCGFGWLMYDFAAAISFIEDDPRIDTFKTAWLEGYRSVRDLSAHDEAEIETLIMLRRMALLAWIGSHIEAPEPQKLAPGFASTTAKLGRAWLEHQP